MMVLRNAITSGTAPLYMLEYTPVPFVPKV